MAGKDGREQEQEGDQDSGNVQQVGVAYAFETKDRRAGACIPGELETEPDAAQGNTGLLRQQVHHEIEQSGSDTECDLDDVDVHPLLCYDQATSQNRRAHSDRPDRCRTSLNGTPRAVDDRHSTQTGPQVDTRQLLQPIAHISLIQHTLVGSDRPYDRASPAPAAACR